jgi:phosphatidylethanolamine/phosphatidyl-N-methylethanolamine N-methyltransferase
VPGRDVLLIQGDTLNLLVGAAAFDAVILNLVLSVVPDGSICLHAALGALKPGGRLVIFDKFTPDMGKLSLGRRLLKQVTTLFGTDITRRFSDLSLRNEFDLISDEPSLLHGAYRVMLITKPAR